MLENTDRDDLYRARQRSVYVTEPFRKVLRTALRECLQDRQRVPLEEFVKYFDKCNIKKNHKPLDTRGVSYRAYFMVLDDVCKLDDDDNLQLCNADRFSTKSDSDKQVSAWSRQFWRTVPSEATAETTQQLPPQEQTSRSSPPLAASTDGAKNLKNLSIQDVQNILVPFTHGLSGRTLSLSEYCAQLKKHDLVAFERFLQLKKTEPSQIGFLLEQVSGIKNTITADKSTSTITISSCSCPSNCSQAVERKEKVSFSQSFKQFVRFKLPLHKVVRVDIVNCESAPHRIRLDFIWKCDQFETLHEKLHLFYKNNNRAAEDIYEGMLCAVPLDSTKDYHRAIVKNVSDPQLPVVFYIDVGIEQGVAKGCIRGLDEKFHTIPTFFLSGEVDHSPPWPKRSLLGQKLLKSKKADLTAVKYSETTERYRLVLETDSGITSDASREGLPSGVIQKRSSLITDLGFSD